jgi:general secretion pathway protein J
MSFRVAKHGSSRGFTLVELLLALTLMSMLLALAYGGLRASTRATDKGQKILEDSSRIRAAHQFVRRQLSQLMPIGFEEIADGEGYSVFIGEDSMIRFVAPMPGYLGFGGPQVQQLAFIPGENGLDLVISHALVQGYEESLLDEQDPIVLLENIEEGGFLFMGRDEQDELTPWLSSWEDTQVLPEAVGVEIFFTEEVYIQWPLLSASVRAETGSLETLVSRANVTPSNPYRAKIREMVNSKDSEN